MREKVWMCSACGRVSPHRDVGSAPDWDESCMMHAVRVYKDSIKREVDAAGERVKISATAASDQTVY